MDIFQYNLLRTTKKPSGVQANRSNDMDNNRIIDGKYIIVNTELKCSDLQVGSLYADNNNSNAVIMRLVRVTETTLSFKYVAGNRTVYLADQGTDYIRFSNIDYSPWYKVNDITNK